MGIGLPVTLVGDNTGGTTGSQFTTVADAPQGSLIVAMFLAGSVDTFTSAFDSVGNIYRKVANNAASFGTAIFACLNSQHDLPKGGYVGINFTGGGSCLAYVVAVSGANGGVDQVVNSGSITVPFTGGVNIGPFNVGNEISFAVLNPGALTGFVELAGWTQLSSFDTTNDQVDFAYQITGNNKAAVTYNPTGVSGNWGLCMASFAVTPIVTVLNPSRCWPGLPVPNKLHSTVAPAPQSGRCAGAVQPYSSKPKVLTANSAFPNAFPNRSTGKMAPTSFLFPGALQPGVTPYFLTVVDALTINLTVHHP